MKMELTPGKANKQLELGLERDAEYINTRAKECADSFPADARVERDANEPRSPRMRKQ